jgi:hypothetical protein
MSLFQELFDFIYTIVTSFFLAAKWNIEKSLTSQHTIRIYYSRGREYLEQMEWAQSATLLLFPTTPNGETLKMEVLRLCKQQKAFARIDSYKWNETHQLTPNELNYT